MGSGYHGSHGHSMDPATMDPMATAWIRLPWIPWPQHGSRYLRSRYHGLPSMDAATPHAASAAAHVACALRPRPPCWPPTSLALGSVQSWLMTCRTQTRGLADMMMHAHAHAHAHTRTYSHAHTHTHMHTHTHTRTHTHTHTYTHTNTHICEAKMTHHAPHRSA